MCTSGRFVYDLSCSMPVNEFELVFAVDIDVAYALLWIASKFNDVIFFFLLMLDFF